MNKSELIEKVAESSGLSKVDATHAVDAIMDSISTELQRGGDVRLVGFGTFSTSSRQARRSRNPRTGEIMSIGASIRPAFKAGKHLKAIVAGDTDDPGPGIAVAESIENHNGE